MHPLSFTLLALLEVALAQAAEVLAPALVAQKYGLATSTTLAFPTATLSTADTQANIISNWGLGKGRIQDGADNLAFVKDPYPDSESTVSTGQLSSNGPVLQVTYPKDSYSHDTGGSQFYNLWNVTGSEQFQSMMVSYEVAFQDGFDWVKGGKLPGLRGGLNSTGCSGGNQPTPTGDCFSVRLMWRKNANGELYAYIPTANKICDRKNVVCNSDFGTSFNRGSFGFVTGRWSRITLLVQLNNPPNVANGQIKLYYNDELAADAQELQIRSSDAVSANGLFFSTFFGGNDASWATPETVNTYFRNIQLWASTGASTLTGPTIKNGAVSFHPAATLICGSIVFWMISALV
ncbi:hypothetical protein D9611_003952 [Ephemerocybe angulata]|uniref:Polysaccharide lyase 14 domain-containing protein n=1 Tax=Ephemerocybe angulata TaxID=980116 RepID=A0A8H5EYP0_9AGAR|nr:hypothetical protein D9611_003952 [Tulosesus angulatus]